MTIVSTLINCWIRAVRVLPKGRYSAFHFGWLLVGQPERFVSRINGLPFVVDVQDRHTALHMVLWGSYEPEFSLVFKSKLTSGATVVDIGANKGFFSLLAAALVLPHGRVISYEPLPRNFIDLAETARLSGYANWICCSAAVSSYRGEARLTESAFEQGHSGWGRISQVGSVAVKTVDLDSEIETMQLKQIDVLKMDIEGHESRAVAGMRRSLARGVIKSAFIEMHLGCLSVAEVEEIVSTFRGNGYRGYVLIENEANAKKALKILKTGATTESSFVLEDFDERRLDDVKTADSRVHVLWTIEPQ